MGGGGERHHHSLAPARVTTPRDYAISISYIAPCGAHPINISHPPHPPHAHRTPHFFLTATHTASVFSDPVCRTAHGGPFTYFHYKPIIFFTRLDNKLSLLCEA